MNDNMKDKKKPGVDVPSVDSKNSLSLSGLKNIESKWVKCISTHGSIRAVAIQATGLIREMSTLHHLQGRYAQGLGEAVMGALLLATYCKGGERVNLNVQGSGDFPQALVDAYPDGRVRGYVTVRKPEFASFGPQGDLGPWGEGVLSVLRTQISSKNESVKQPFIGTVPLVTGHLAKDLTYYWAQSEQVPSAVGLAVGLKGSEVISAGGFLVQVMPQATSSDIKLIEKHIAEIDSLSDQILKNSNPMYLLAQILQSTSFVVLEEKSIKFDCQCSRQRVERALLLTGPDELEDILQKEKSVSIHCDFCKKEYSFNETEIRALVALMLKDSVSRKQ